VGLITSDLEMRGRYTSSLNSLNDNVNGIGNCKVLWIFMCRSFLCNEFNYFLCHVAFCHILYRQCQNHVSMFSASMFLFLFGSIEKRYLNYCYLLFPSLMVWLLFLLLYH